MKTMVFALLGLLVPGLAAAEIQGHTVEYKDKDTVLEGYVASQKAVEGKRPGVIVVPDWMGVSQHYKDIAGKLADMGYVAFVADIYGKAVRPTNSQEASAEATKYKSNRPLMRERVLAALEQLKKAEHVDDKRLAAIGYCFGGTVALELARTGAPLLGVVSFHGGLDTPTPDDAKNMKAKVLALHGADDPYVPPKDVASFQDEMRKGNVDWQMIFYGNAVHGFTMPAAGKDKSKGLAYDAKADKRSWQAMKDFFQEIFH